MAAVRVLSRIVVANGSAAIATVTVGSVVLRAALVEVASDVVEVARDVGALLLPAVVVADFASVVR